MISSLQICGRKGYHVPENMGWVTIGEKCDDVDIVIGLVSGSCVRVPFVYLDCQSRTWSLFGPCPYSSRSKRGRFTLGSCQKTSVGFVTAYCPD